MDKKFVLQVDRLDNPIGLIEKQEAHVKGILHRAFSVFIFRCLDKSVELLLQQRALVKYHSGGLWTNTCCSHADADTPIGCLAESRLRAEMGFLCPLHFVDSFYYRADFENGMIEHAMVST